MRAYALLFLLLVGCHKSENAVPNAEKADASDYSPPVSAHFVELSPGESARSEPVPRCSELIVTPVRGNVAADEAPLAQGDVLAVRGRSRVTMRGQALVLVAAARVPCDAPRAQAVVKADAARDLSFMHGAMHARLDLDDRSAAPSFYFGRLSGTAGVPEHTHAGTWELLCAVEASGTFTLAGAPSHLGARQCVVVPPDTKHSWQPEPGSTLTALQMYWPPGPEQRFKKLAADEVDAGPGLPGEGRDH